MSEQKNNKNKPTEKKDELAYPSQKILEASIDGFCVISLEGKLLGVNSAVCNITGYSKEELLKMKITDLEVGETAEQIAQHSNNTLKRGYDRFETKHRCKDGKIIDVEVSTQLYDSEDSKFFFSFFRDITARKRIEQKLQESETRYRILVENLPAITYTAAIDPQSTTLYVSPQVEKILGVTVSDYKADPDFWRKLLHPEDYERVMAELAQSHESSKPFISEYRMVAKDGHEVYIRDEARIIKNDDGKPLYLQGVMYDITERKKIEEILRESEERYKTLFQSAAEGIVVADIETKKFYYVNPAMCKILGYTEEELLQLGVSDIHPKEALPHVFSEFEAQAQGEKTLSPELPCLRKDGNVIYTDINTTNATIDGKACNVGFFTDVTERKQAEEEIRKFRTIAEKANYGVAISDIDGNLIYVNEYFAAIHGYTAEQLVGENLTILHNKEQFKKCLRINEKLKETGNINAVEIWHLHKCGTVFPMLMSSIIIKDENDEPRYMATTAIDITEKKRLESEYEKYKEKILSIQRHVYISTLSSIMAHQINQPLTKIGILLDRALESINNAEDIPCCPAVTKNIQEGLAEAKNIDSIIRKFREHSKNPAQKSSVKTNINAVAKRIISTLSEMATRAKMIISTKGLDNLPEIEINEIALEQIFLIIIQNAVEAADDSKKHKFGITGKLTDGNIELQFADDCCGITSENLDRIFEPFFSTKTENGGLGLGLDILQQLLINCGGQVRAESQLGKGTTFYVTLPVNAVPQ